MSIQKKSLISALKTAKKANVASTGDVDVKGSKVASIKLHTKTHLKASPRPQFKVALKVAAKATTKASPRPVR
jgi:hypothetical protein